MATRKADAPPALAAKGRALTAREAAEVLSVSVPGLYKAVKLGHVSEPFYPLPRAPRWWEADLHADAERRRMVPSEAKLARRVARLERERIASDQERGSAAA